MEIVEGDVRYIRFPAAHPEVGDIEIYDDGDELTVVYGHFTHCHYDAYGSTSDDWRLDAVNAVVVDLEALFSDRLRMWGDHKSAGGIVREGDKPSRFWAPKGPFYVWSGPVEDAA
jgi:hypothetical protein